jgi:hypothetical protein
MSTEVERPFSPFSPFSPLSPLSPLSLLSPPPLARWPTPSEKESATTFVNDFFRAVDEDSLRARIAETLFDFSTLDGFSFSTFSDFSGVRVALLAVWAACVDGSE